MVWVVGKTVEKWRTAQVSVNLSSLAVAMVLAVIGMSSLILLTRSPKPQLQEAIRAPVENGIEGAVEVEDELVEIARRWAEDNIDGVAGDELVRFIVDVSNTRQPEELGRFVKERLSPVTTWTYGPIVGQGGDMYEVTVTASTLVHEIVPVRNLGIPEGVSAPEAQRVVTMPFHLNVNLRSKSVSDWHTHGAEANYSTNFSTVSIEEEFGEAVGECIHLVMASGLPDSLAIALFTEPREREWIEAEQLNEAIGVAGLTEECEEWVGASH